MLSAGQRPRIAVVRVKRAASARRARAPGGVARCTALVIVRQRSTVIGGDRILVLHRGRVEDQRTHAEWLARNEVYGGSTVASSL